MRFYGEPLSCFVFVVLDAAAVFCGARAVLVCCPRLNGSRRPYQRTDQNSCIRNDMMSQCCRVATQIFLSISVRVFFQNITDYVLKNKFLSSKTLAF